MFNIVDDDPAPASEWLPHLAECAGASRRGASRSGWPDSWPVTRRSPMTEGRAFSNAKAKRVLGWRLRYPSWREGFKAELA